MSILIKGLEMPKNCGECKFFAWKRIVGNHCAICDNITFHATLDGLDVNYERNGDCPLIEVPPHGRLIDADAIHQSIKESIDECHKWAEEVDGGDMYARVSQSLGTFVECALRIKAAPTIIEAEVDDG